MKRCSESMPQSSRKTPMWKCDFIEMCDIIEITLPHGCSPVNLLHIFNKNTFEELLLNQIYLLGVNTYTFFQKAYSVSQENCSTESDSYANRNSRAKYEKKKD